MSGSDQLFVLILILAGCILVYRLLGLVYTSWRLGPSDDVSYLNDFNSESNIENISFDLDSNSKSYFNVFCASERSLSQPFNFTPWESRGQLLFDGSDIHFSGVRYRSKVFSLRKKAVKVKYRFPRNQVKISYLPSRILSGGGLSWLKMEIHNRRFYFTSGHRTQIKVGGPKVTTQDIYEIVSDF